MTNLDHNCVPIFECIYREVIGDGTGMNYMYCKRLLDYYHVTSRDEDDVWTRIVDGNHNDHGKESLRFILWR